MSINFTITMYYTDTIKRGEIQLQAFGNVERPKFASGWSLRFQIQFLFPK